MGWWNRGREGQQSGVALFRGGWVPRPEDFRSIEAAGIRLGPAKRLEARWSAEVEHPRWGRGTLVSAPGFPVPPELLVALDSRLNENEKAEVASCRVAVGLSCERRTGNVLADRKDLLRFLHALLGDAGIAALDCSAQAIWSRGGLEAELAHDAELDIEAIHTLHLIQSGSDDPSRRTEEGVCWLHSHGLANIGFWDFDILDPSPDLTGHAQDLLRALAFNVVEARLAPDGAPGWLAEGASVRAVSVREFLRDSRAEDHLQYRAMVDPDHTEKHAVLCDEDAQTRVRRFFRGSWPRPSRFLQAPIPERLMILFSTSPRS